MYSFIKDKNESIDSRLLEQALVAMERKYNFSFPAVLRNYYIEYDGSRIKLCVIPLNGYEFEISTIVPILASGLTFEKIVANDREDGWIDKNFFPLAMNRGGDTYYWDAVVEHVFFVSSDDVDNPVSVCNSITEFFLLMESNIVQS